MQQFHVGIILGNFNHCLAPQQGIGQHIGLVHAGDALTAAARSLERHFGDTHHLAFMVAHGIHDDFVVSLPFAETGLAEIQAASQFPDT